MSDYHEITLRRHEEELEQRHHWEEYSDTEEETAQLIEKATAEGLKYSCIRHIYA